MILKNIYLIKIALLNMISTVWTWKQVQQFVHLVSFAPDISQNLLIVIDIENGNKSFQNNITAARILRDDFKYYATRNCVQITKKQTCCLTVLLRLASSQTARNCPRYCTHSPKQSTTTSLLYILNISAFVLVVIKSTLFHSLAAAPTNVHL